MLIPPKYRRAFYLPFAAFIGFAAFTAPANTHVATLESSSDTMQNASTQSRSLLLDTYPGTIVFEDQYGNKWDGPASLEVKKDRKFTLTTGGKKYDGDLVTVTDAQGFPGGSIKFDGDRKISIRWIQDPKHPKRIKIINVKGDCIKFRFCSDQVDPDECRTQLKVLP
jgi:hypothetical protein